MSLRAADVHDGLKNSYQISLWLILDDFGFDTLKNHNFFIKQN